MRQPSIHITHNKLKDIIRDYLDIYEEDRSEEFIDSLVDYIATQGNRFQLTSRKKLAYDLLSTQKQKKKIELASRSYKADAQLFAKILVSIRKAKKHRGISIIKEGNKEWGIIKEVTSLATSFCKDFNLELKEGYVEYIETAMQVLPTFSLNRINYKHEEISKTYEALSEIRKDNNPELTSEIYDNYYQIIASKTGITNDYRKRPLKFVHFVRAAKAVKELDIKPFDYVNAQFKSLEWINGLPDPSQLNGDGAVERLQKHMFSNQKAIKRSGSDLRKIMLGHDKDQSK